MDASDIAITDRLHDVFDELGISNVLVFVVNPDNDHELSVRTGSRNWHIGVLTENLWIERDKTREIFTDRPKDCDT